MKINFAGEEFILHSSGALYWPAQEILIVADAHLEKGSFFARWGFHLPPYDSSITLKKLVEACENMAAKKILVLGDFLHDNLAFQRLGHDEKILFEELRKYSILWVRGNHDSEFIPEGIEVLDEYMEAGIVFRHEASGDKMPEISGHFHPKIKFYHKGCWLDGRCFIEDGRKMMLPAFGAYTGGLSVQDKAIKRHFGDSHRSYIIINDRIVALPSSNL